MAAKPAARVHAAFVAFEARESVTTAPDHLKRLAGLAVITLDQVELEPRQDPPGVALNPNDLTLVQLLANGGDPRSIATQMHRPVAWVSAQLERIKTRVGVQTFAQLVGVSMARGWLESGRVRIPVGVPRGKAGVKSSTRRWRA